MKIRNQFCFFCLFLSLLECDCHASRHRAWTLLKILITDSFEVNHLVHNKNLIQDGMPFQIKNCHEFLIERVKTTTILSLLTYQDVGLCVGNQLWRY